ncbi:MAG: transcriptional regulator [Sphaerotilus natans subsp. sulfidivorans]|uniref:helix-turn-helix transcriptional regulator n=1 Tax=Sphaerotilus sulfidivorans TaxID=639200 RepID=UPI00235518A5|nr:transcriptional regulator [Sphaerotilus sulfidivorans]MCK6402034.1 transcriptional regulator [Sphaerotilus sulfidivorans]
MPRKTAPDLKTFADAPDDARIRLDTVTALMAVSRNTIWRRVKAGQFPAPKKDGGATFWKVGDVRRHLAGA